MLWVFHAYWLLRTGSPCACLRRDELQTRLQLESVRPGLPRFFLAECSPHLRTQTGISRMQDRFFCLRYHAVGSHITPLSLTHIALFLARDSVNSHMGQPASLQARFPLGNGPQDITCAVMLLVSLKNGEWAGRQIHLSDPEGGHIG